MTDEEKQTEIVAMVTERNGLRSEIACLKNKMERIRKALSQVCQAIDTNQRLSIVNDTSIVAGSDGQALPPVTEIKNTHDRLIDATKRLDEIEQRLDGV